MKIRTATKKDIPKLVKIVRGATSIEDYPGEYDNKLFKKMINSKETILLVAEIDGKIVGFNEFRVDRDANRLYEESVAVSKKYRGKGVGSALFAAMELYAKEHKIKRISLLVRSWNKSMNFLAKKKKFKISDKFNFWEKKLR